LGRLSTHQSSIGGSLFYLFCQMEAKTIYDPTLKIRLTPSNIQCNRWGHDRSPART
jgi:hypothetical protein